MVIPMLRALCALMTVTLFSTNIALASKIRDNGPHAFLSIPLTVSHNPYQIAWRRVSAGSGISTSVSNEARMLNGLSKLHLVNQWVNSSITYEDDAENWSANDYWATAEQTLNKRAGDCEDIAILKMQILRAAGVPASTMYMTIGSDLAAERAHAVLVVRNNGQFWVLDSTTDTIQMSDGYIDFRPIFSLGATATWLHGYALASASAPPTEALKRPHRLARLAEGHKLAAVIAAQKQR